MKQSGSKVHQVKTDDFSSTIEIQRYKQLKAYLLFLLVESGASLRGKRKNNPLGRQTTGHAHHVLFDFILAQRLRLIREVKRRQLRGYAFESMLSVAFVDQELQRLIYLEFLSDEIGFLLEQNK